MFLVAVSSAAASAAAAAAAAADRALPGEAADDAEEALLWESVACAIEYAADLPHAWGIASALRYARPTLAAAVAAAPAAPAAAAATVARWLSRAVADAFFVPVDECSGLLAWASATQQATQEEGGGGGEGGHAGGGGAAAAPSTGGLPPADELWSCARGWSFFYFIFVDRFELGMAVDDTVGAVLSVTTSFGGGLDRLLLHLLKLAVTFCCPEGGASGYFVNVQLEAAWVWVLLVLGPRGAAAV